MNKKDTKDVYDIIAASLSNVGKEIHHENMKKFFLNIFDIKKNSEVLRLFHGDIMLIKRFDQINRSTRFGRFARENMLESMENYTWTKLRILRSFDLGSAETEIMEVLNFLFNSVKLNKDEYLEACYYVIEAMLFLLDAPKDEEIRLAEEVFGYS